MLLTTRITLKVAEKATIDGLSLRLDYLDVKTFKVGESGAEF